MNVYKVAVLPQGTEPPFTRIIGCSAPHVAITRVIKHITPSGMGNMFHLQVTVLEKRITKTQYYTKYLHLHKDEDGRWRDDQGGYYR